MPNIPSDYYLEHINPDIYSDILEFHSKSNYLLHESTKHITKLHSLDSKALLKLTGNQLELVPGGPRLNITTHPLLDDHPLLRRTSAERFRRGPINFREVLDLTRPLITRKGSNKRGYPSGGALYPVEIFLCRIKDDIEGWPCCEDILHLLPEDRTFEKLDTQMGRQHMRSAIIPDHLNIGCPSLAIVLAAFLPKVVFKYRYRGYRLALMEAGSIYQIVELMAKSTGLGVREWSGFCDHMVTKSLGLNPTLYLPLCTTLIGTPDEPQ